MKYSLLFENEFSEQKRALEKAEKIVLYGNSVIACILDVVISELGYEAKCSIFERGRFLSQEENNVNIERTVIILCSARALTRQDMKKDALHYFPGTFIFDFFAIYYIWITKIVKRKCDYEKFAETLFLCRQEKCVPNIDSINTFYCNLKCKECSNGIQYRRKKRKISSNLQIIYLNKFTEKLPICQCNFQGGEVFTDIDFSTFIEDHSHNPRVAIFTVATNGTILPKDETFMSIKRIGVMIRISDYGNISKQKEAIIAKCKKFSIPCFTFPMAEKWRKFGEYYKRNRKKDELKQISQECCFGTHDLMFIENKIYCCLRTLYANAVGDDTEAMRLNTLDLNSNFTYEELERFIHGKELWRMCDYCDFPMKVIAPAEQL